MDVPFHSWGVFIAGGLFFFVVPRLPPRGKPASYFKGFGAWAHPPRLVAATFGDARGRIRWDLMSAELMGLVMGAFGALGSVLSPPPRSILFVVLALPIVLSIVIAALVFLVVAVGRMGQE